MRTRLALPVLASLVWLSAPAAQARAQGKEIALAGAAAEVIDCLTAIPERGIPPAMLCDAQAVAIFPNVVKGSFILGGRHGHGVLLVREPFGGWSNPVFLTISGGSIGWQAGVQSTDLVLIFRTTQSVDRFLQGKGKLSLGADASVAAGPVGREAAAATDARLKAEIYTYSRSRGLFAGVSLAGDAILLDWRANERFYGNRAVCVADILAGQNILLPAAALQLRATLAKQTPPR
jgi:lipid-binding SYLF domain-containing protein